MILFHSADLYISLLHTILRLVFNGGRTLFCTDKCRNQYVETDWGAASQCHKLCSKVSYHTLKGDNSFHLKTKQSIY